MLHRKPTWRSLWIAPLWLSATITHSFDLSSSSFSLQRARCFSRPMSLYSSSSPNDDDNDDMQDLERAREAFEALPGALPSLSAATNTIKPLTTSARRNLEMEVTLLQHLATSDEAIDPLVDFWVRERQDSAERLQRMEGSQCSPGMVQEEQDLRDMVASYGDDWIEPAVRLALILAIRGHWSEALPLCRRALKVKPWHFEAGQLLVTLHLKLQDFGQALQAARRYTLPNWNDRTHHRHRRAWVERNVQLATERLEQAALATAVATMDQHILVDDECPVFAENSGGADPACWQ